MSAFDRTMDRFPLEARAKIEDTLEHWAGASDVGRRVAENVTREEFLPEDDMESLLAVLLRHHGVWVTSSEDWEEPLKAEWQTTCFSLGLRDGPVELDYLPPLLGHALERGDWKQDLLKIERNWRGRDVEEFLERLVNGGPLSDRERRYLIHEHTVWVTWEEPGGSGDPFSFARFHRADEVRACLALDPRTTPLLLLVYERRRELLRPTIADAETGNLRFRPNTSSCDCGWTDPWNEDEIPNDLLALGFHAQSRPEAVHESENLQVLDRRQTREFV